MSKRIVILGGGYGGVYAGKLLHKKLKKEKDVEITLIDKKPYHTLMTELHEIAGSRTPEDSVRVGLDKIFAKRKVNVVQDEINNIDFDERVLSSVDNSYEYDYLIIGTGAEPMFFGVEGAEENSLTLWSYEDALQIKEHILNMFREAEKETSEKKRKEMLTFVVAGGGFTGVEMVGELVEWTRKLVKQYNVNKEEIKVINVDALPSIVTHLPEKLQIKAIKRLEKMGVEVLLSSPINKVTNNSVTIGEDNIVKTKTCIWTAGVKSSTFSEKIGLTPGEKGGIKTNSYMQSVDYEDVYIVGDNVSYVEEEVGPLPKIVETAHFTAETAVHNIVSEIKGKNKKEHSSSYHGVMVSIGSKYAVASVGGKKKINMSGWMAMLTKHFINLFYLLQIAGFNRVWTYLMHEFFHVKDRRSFVGGHFSKSSPNFWLVPLRIYLGLLWLLEGLKKIDEGWFTQAKTLVISTTPSGGSDATSGATEAAGTASDATAAATEVAESTTEAAGEAVRHAPEFIQDIIDFLSPIKVPSDWSNPLMEAPQFLQKINEQFLEPNAVTIQRIMVLAEIVLGLCLIVGLFTFISSLTSVAMTVGITLTGMADASILVYFFGGIALFGGSGSVFGLDYYVLPWLKEKWKKIGFVKKHYLYTD